MSKKWKIAIGVIVAAIVISGIGLLSLGSVIYWNSGGKYGWSLGAYISELVWGPGASAYLPKARAFVWGFGPGRGVPFGRGFGPGRVWSFGPIFGPFAIVGGLANLVFFALLIGLVVVFFRRCCQRGNKAG